MNTKLYTYLFVLLISCLNVSGSTDTIRAGSYIINMGVVPQTIGNGLKPYGLVYDLLKNHNVSIQWVINPSKVKDGIDFSHNGISYRGGAFIISAAYRTSTVNSVIASWEAQGVVGNTTVSDFIIDVAKTLNYAPNWTMDKTNGYLATSYFINAGIPSSAHGGDSANWKNPSELGACDDIFVLPHADPTWATHNNLYYWNLNYKGNIWAACHAVSAMENLTSPDNSIKMNFLSTAGLVATALHRRHSTPPFIYSNPNDFVMQFMGILDGATINGSERTFLPVIGGSWRTTTTVSVSDIEDDYIPSLSNGPGGVVAYGKAYGDQDRGWVMYEAGHSHDETGTTAEKVAAQRAFFNYSFFVAADRYADFPTSINGLESLVTSNVPVQLSVNVPDWVDLSKYTIQWTSSRGGTFTPANSEAVTFTPPLETGPLLITVSLTDACDRVVFSNQASFMACILSNRSTLKGRYVGDENKVLLTWKGTEQDNSSYQIERSTGKGNFITIGTVTNKGAADYMFEDNDPGTGLSSYRLVTILPSGKKLYSNIVALNGSINLAGGLHSVVNPAKGKIIFSYTSSTKESISAKVYDINGRQMAEKMYLLQPGSNTFEIQPSNQWPGGCYFLRVASKNEVSTRKVYFAP